MNITLIGYRGTGKSTVARLVADRLGWNWIDADELLETQAGRSIREIFAIEGEAGFRDCESAVIHELATRDRIVIAAGGGAVLRPENRDAIRRDGFTVWLRATPATIRARLAADPTTPDRRPALSDRGPLDEIEAVLREREPLYLECADFVVDTDAIDPNQLADVIVERFPASSTSPRTE